MSFRVSHCDCDDIDPAPGTGAEKDGMHTLR